MSFKINDIFKNPLSYKKVKLLKLASWMYVKNTNYISRKIK